MIKKVLYSLENILGKNIGHKKISVTDLEGNTFIRHVSHSKIQKLILDPNIKSVRFIK